MNRDTLEQDPCNTCGYEEGSIYCKEHCPHEAKIKQELTEFEEIDFMQEHKKIPVTLDLTSCGDAIDRRLVCAFIDGLISDDEERKKGLEYIRSMPPVTPQPKTGHWIPVSERLPDKYTYTLWCASSGYVRSDYFNGEFWEDAKKYCYEIVAWMPLPEPYKGE